MRWFLFLMGVALTACDPPTAPEPPSVSLHVEVTDQVRKDLDEEGRFTDRSLLPDHSPGIDAERGRELAAAVIRTLVTNPKLVPLPGAVSLREDFERGHGGSIDWANVELGSRPLYSYTPLDMLLQNLPPAWQRSFGPHWLVPLIEDGRQVGLISVSSEAVAARIDANGYLELSPETGELFHSMGVPGEIRHPMSPEAAVRLVYSRFGERIAAVPRLVQPGNRIRSTLAFWELVLERPVTVSTDTEGLRTTDTLYASAFDFFAPAWAPTLYVASVEQPDGETFQLHGESYWVRRRPGLPLVIRRVTRE